VPWLRNGFSVAGTSSRDQVSNPSDTRVPEKEATPMAFSMAGNGSPTAQINITPLIDVLLVLIIVFMVVVSMSQEKGLEAEIPQPAKDATSQPQTRDETIVVQLVWSGSDQSPTLKINQDN
jgi:biopolymer transport protein TolR